MPLSPDQYQAFKTNLRALIVADEKIELFEWVLQRMVFTHLRPHFERVKPPRIRHTSLRKLSEPCAVVLSILAHAGSPSEASVRTAFELGAAQLSGIDIALLPHERAGLRELDRALEKLAEVDPSTREQLLEGLRGLYRGRPRNHPGGRRTLSRNRRRHRLPDAAPSSPVQPLY